MRQVQPGPVRDISTRSHCLEPLQTYQKGRDGSASTYSHNRSHLVERLRLTISSVTQSYSELEIGAT
jgi:hypothetical protein